MLLLATALAAWALSAIYSLYLNPEVVHYHQGDVIKRAWAAQMTREHGSKTIIYGGSSCEFSVDGERLLANFGEPVVNDGRHAGMGAVVLTESVLGELRRGDTLIVAIEPFLMTAPMDGEPALGVQFSVALHHPEWVLHPVVGAGKVDAFQAAMALRPGGYHVFTLLGKWMRGEPLYRYKLSDYHRSGWKQTAVRIPQTAGAGFGPHLSDGAQIMLTNLSRWCQTNGVRLAYSLPWCYCPPDQLRDFQLKNAEYLAQMTAFVPVLRDPTLGADPVATDFGDAALHPDEVGAAKRTDELGRELQQWDIWKRADLEREISDLKDPVLSH